MGNPRFLSTQSCFVSTGSPAQQIEALRKWNPTKHRELKVFLHSDLPANPTPANFSKLQNAPDNRLVRSLVSATQKLSPELQISKDEAKKFSSASGGGGGAMPAAVAKFWSDVMAARTHSFSSGGTSAQPPYDHGGQNIRAGGELNGLLKQQEKIRHQFFRLLRGTGSGRGGGPLNPVLYLEPLDDGDQRVVPFRGSLHHPCRG